MGLHRFSGQMPLHVGGESVGRFVTPRRSFSNAFMTIQSSSLRSRPVSLFGSVPRLAEMFGSAFAVLSRMLGRGGSSSRTTRSISNIPAFFNSALRNGGLPASSS